MNFNFTGSPDYTLNTSLIEEMINMYGVMTKFLVTEKINSDDTVFGDYSHLKTDAEKIFDIYMLPETSDDWEANGYGFSDFGLVNMENVIMFAAKSSFDPIPDIITDMQDIIGNLIVLPNNKVMEITDAQITVPGVNNLFTHNDAKSVYQLTCRPYDFKLINEIDSVDISAEPDVPYETLDSYFNDLVVKTEEQDIEVEVVPSMTTVQKTGDIDVKVQKPIVDKSEDDVWGSFS